MYLFSIIVKKNNMKTKLDKILAEISAGELIDKITILEIKKDKITNQEKLLEINRELVSLNQTFAHFIPKNQDIEKLINNSKKLI